MRQKRVHTVYIVLLATVLFTVHVTTVWSAIPSCPCPEGYTAVAKYQCDEGDWWLDEGQDEFTFDGDCQQASVGGDYDLLYVKAGVSCEEQESPVTAIDGHDISHVNVCREKPTSVGMVRFSAKRGHLPSYLFSVLRDLWRGLCRKLELVNTGFP